jgi:hypothetical protein
LLQTALNSGWLTDPGGLRTMQVPNLAANEMMAKLELQINPLETASPCFNCLQ